MPVCSCLRPVVVGTATCSTFAAAECPLYRWSADREYDNPSIYCHDHAVFIQHAITRLRELGLDDSLVVPASPVHVS